MIKLGKTQGLELAKALYDVGKLVLAVLVIGQFVSAPFRFGVFVVGFVVFVATFVVATLINKEGE